jgi:hypothetical protein
MITFLAGRGDGSFADPVSYPADLPLNSTITSLNSADLNGDGYLDLVATSGGVAVYLGNGDGTFAQPVLYNDVSDRSFAGSLSATTTDINADGIPDVITASAENPSNSIEVFLGNPDGTLQRPALYPVPSVVSFLAFADLNGDGRIDGVIASLSGVVILNGTQAPFLRLKVSHTGNFYLRQDADFTVQVSNVANASATNGSVKVTDFPIPAPYSILRSLSGDGWTCDLSSCSRSDPLQPGESYPPIAVVVLFFDPVTLATNLASVSGTNLPITDATDTDTVLPYTTQCLLSLEGLRNMTVSADGGAVEFSIHGAGTQAGVCPVQVQPSDSWLIANSAGMSIAPNTTGAARSGSLDFTSPTGWSDSIVIHQLASGCAYQLSPSYVIVDAMGTFFDVGTGVNTAVSCTWTATSNADWITITKGTGNGMYLGATFSVAPNSSGKDRSGTVTISGQTFTVFQKSGVSPGLSSMPHLAVGGGWDTVVQLVNTSSSLAWLSVGFFADSGFPFPIPTSITGEDTDGAGNFNRMIGPHSVLTDTSLGTGSVQAQVASAQLSADSGVSGFIRFHYAPNGQEAIVPLETRNASSYSLMFDNTGGITTGAAIANLASTASTVPVVIRNDGGMQLGSASITLPAQGHSSFTLSDQFISTVDQTGTIEFDTPTAGRISVLGLRFPPSFHFSTIPVVASTDVGGSFAHLAVGGGWTTTIELINTGASAAHAHLQFYSDDGNPLPLSLSFPQSGGSSTAASFDQTLAPHSRSVIGAAGSSVVQVGSARLTSDGAVTGFIRFRYIPWDQETIVPIDSRSANAYTLAFDNTNGAATGVAVVNLAGTPANIPVVIRDASGAQIGSGAIALPANGHSSFTSTDRFAATLNQQGTLEFDTPAGRQISVLGIRFPQSRAFTSIPVVTP